MKTNNNVSLQTEQTIYGIVQRLVQIQESIEALIPGKDNSSLLKSIKEELGMLNYECQKFGDDDLGLQTKIVEIQKAVRDFESIDKRNKLLAKISDREEKIIHITSLEKEVRNREQKLE
jgi:hypothetical protein